MDEAARHSEWGVHQHPPGCLCSVPDGLKRPRSLSVVLSSSLLEPSVVCLRGQEDPMISACETEDGVVFGDMSELEGRRAAPIRWACCRTLSILLSASSQGSMSVTLVLHLAVLLRRSRKRRRCSPSGHCPADAAAPPSLSGPHRRGVGATRGTAMRGARTRPVVAGYDSRSCARSNRRSAGGPPVKRRTKTNQDSPWPSCHGRR